MHKRSACLVSQQTGFPRCANPAGACAQVRARLRPDLVAQHAEAFLINGDMNSNLYTSSRAMHSAILGLLQPEGSGLARAGVGRLQNLSLSVQRRWNNVLSDATRQARTVCPVLWVFGDSFAALLLGAPTPPGSPN